MISKGLVGVLNLGLTGDQTQPGRRQRAWPSGQRVGLTIQRSQVRVRLCPLAGFVLGRPEPRL